MVQFDNSRKKNKYKKIISEKKAEILHLTDENKKFNKTINQLKDQLKQELLSQKAEILQLTDENKKFNKTTNNLQKIISHLTQRLNNEKETTNKNNWNNSQVLCISLVAGLTSFFASYLVSSTLFKKKTTKKQNQGLEEEEYDY